MFCYRLLVSMWFLVGRVPLSLGAWDRLRYFIVAHPWPSMYSVPLRPLIILMRKKMDDTAVSVIKTSSVTI